MLKESEISPEACGGRRRKERRVRLGLAGRQRVLRTVWG